MKPPFQDVQTQLTSSPAQQTPRAPTVPINRNSELCIERRSTICCSYIMCCPFKGTTSTKMMNNRLPIVGPLFQQQNPRSNNLGFGPHHHGGPQQANYTNDGRPSFENDLRRAYSEQYPVQRQQCRPQSQLSNRMTFDYVFPVKGATSINVLGTRPPASAIRCPFVDPMLLDQALSSSAIRNSVRDNSTQWQQMDNDMMQYEEYPWDSRDIFEAIGGTKVSYHGEYSMMQQRSSLAHKDIVFPSTQIPSSSQSGQRVNLSQVDTSRRPHPSRMMTDLRGWLPSLDYDSNGNISSRALGAPMLPLPASARSGSSYVKDQLQLNQERKRPAPSSDSRKDEGISKKAHCSRSPMAGEHRIKISFIELGTLGETPQYFGAKCYEV